MTNVGAAANAIGRRQTRQANRPAPWIIGTALLVAALALRLGRAVRWSESRSESMTALVHGRAQVHTVELGAKEDGTLVGLRADILADMGAFPLATYLVPTTRRMLSGVYRIPALASRGRAVVTPTTPIAATKARCSRSSLTNRSGNARPGNRNSRPLVRSSRSRHV